MTLTKAFGPIRWSIRSMALGLFSLTPDFDSGHSSEEDGSYVKFLLNSSKPNTSVNLQYPDGNPLHIIAFLASLTEGNGQEPVLLLNTGSGIC